MTNSELLCLCGSNSLYNVCCQPFHKGDRSPVTAEDLMRSRYTAYAMRDDVYLIKTWDVATQPKEIDFSKENVTWTKLEIVSIKKGGEKHNKGVVEFKAYYTSQDDEYVLNEISRFKKSAGQWLYMDGVIKSTSKVGQQTNQGKNAPCACGSGKKYKRCCGK